MISAKGGKKLGSLVSKSLHYELYHLCHWKCYVVAVFSNVTLVAEGDVNNPRHPGGLVARCVNRYSVNTTGNGTFSSTFFLGKDPPTFMLLLTPMA